MRGILFEGWVWVLCGTGFREAFERCDGGVNPALLADRAPNELSNLVYFSFDDLDFMLDLL